jgi:hypothetical protein|tara:strand:- start:5019 stop:5309 length:291 start_codon:yes stop_codon:yes gene_type:complete
MSKDIIKELQEAKLKRQEELKSSIAEANELAMLVDGHDNALAGWSTDGKAIYRVYDIVATLMERDGMTYEEAMEFFDFNILGSYVGEYTPIYMYEE